MGEDSAREVLAQIFSSGSRSAILGAYRLLMEADPNLRNLIPREQLEGLVAASLRRQMVDGRLVLEYLEMDIAYACNLHCEGCSHYSNYTMKGFVPYEQGEAWLESWAPKLVPQQFRMLGGEPSINPRLTDFVRLAHRLWPDTVRAVTSNGLLLKRQQDSFFQAMGETQTSLHISLHSRTPEYLEALDRPWLEEKARDFGFALSIRDEDTENFHKLYQGEGADMEPFYDKDPFSSWISCAEKSCPTIHRGRLVICPPLAFLDLVDEKFGIGKKDCWKAYLNHKGVEPSASMDEIIRYLSTASGHCAMCPATLNNRAA
jgi:uncharacterized Fe-S cluster-containing radical SAM superfamily protein